MTRRKTAVVAVFMIAAMFMPSCAALKSPRVDPTTKADLVIYESLAAIQDAEMLASRMGVVTLEGHKRLSSYLVLAWSGEKAFNNALDAKTRLQAATGILDALDAMAPQIVTLVAKGEQRDKMLTAVTLGIATLKGIVAALPGGAA